MVATTYRPMEDPPAVADPAPGDPPEGPLDVEGPVTLRITTWSLVCTI